jgi:O-antigen/teichoic acid export membrane protein
MIDTVLFRAISQVATVVGYVVLVRSMSKEDFGILNLLYAFIPVVSTAASLGLEQTLRRYQPEYLRAGNNAAAAWLVRFAASARFGTSVILLSAVLLTWNWLAPVFKLTDYRGAFALFCPLVVLFFQARILQLALNSHMLHRLSVGSVAVVSVIKLVAYAVVAWRGSLTLVNAIVVDTVAYGASYLLLTLVYRVRCLPQGSRDRYRPPPSERRRLLKYGFFNNFNDAGTYVLSVKSDNFFIAALMDPVSVGIYSFYTRLSEMALTLLPVRLFENVIQPLFFSIPPEEASKRVPTYFSLLLDANLMLQMPVLAFAIGYHAELVHVIFGGKFIEHSYLLPVIVAFLTINTVSTPATLVAQYEEKASIILLSKIFGAYNIVAILLLLPIAGLLGATLASGSAQTFKNLFIWWHVRGNARWLTGAKVVMTCVAIWGGAVALCYLVKSVTDLPDLANLAIGGLIWGVAVLAHLRSSAISASDRRILDSVLKGREARLLSLLGLSGGRTAP